MSDEPHHLSYLQTPQSINCSSTAPWILSNETTYLKGAHCCYEFVLTSTCVQVPQQSSEKNHCIDYFKALQSISQLQLSSSTAPWLLNTTLTHLMISLCCLKLWTVFTICCWSLADRLSDRIVAAHPLYVTLQSPTTYQIAKVINSFLLCRHWLVFWSVFALAPTWSPWR